MKTRIADQERSEPRGERKGGRPRDKEKDAAIADAMLRMMAEHGYDNASFEKVAAAANVSRATIYRRWSSKDHLVVHAVGELLRSDLDPAAVEGADPILLVRDMLVRVSHRLRDPFKVRVISALLSAVPSRPDLGVLLGDLERSRRSPLQDALRAGQASGVVAADADPDLLIDALLGALYFRALISQTPVTPSVAIALADAVLAGQRGQNSRRKA